jgi:hypothetical protein
MRKTEEGFRDFKKDHFGFPILGGSAIVGVINQIIKPVEWQRIVMPSNIACKQFLVTERDKNIWRLSSPDDPDGAAFFTVTGPLAMEIAASEDQLLFYAQLTTGSGGDDGMLEVLLVD